MPTLPGTMLQKKKDTNAVTVISWKVRLNTGTGKRHLTPSTAKGPQDVGGIASHKRTRYLHCNVN